MVQPDGKRIGSAEYWNVIKIRDRTTGEEMITIQKHGRGGAIGGLAFSPDGRHITSRRNGEIGSGDADTGQKC